MASDRQAIAKRCPHNVALTLRGRKAKAFLALLANTAVLSRSDRATLWLCLTITYCGCPGNCPREFGRKAFTGIMRR